MCAVASTSPCSRSRRAIRCGLLVITMWTSTVTAQSPAEPHLFQDRDAAYWVTQLDPSQSLERQTTAALALLVLEEPAEGAVQALIAALKRRGSDELRVLSAQALGKFGEFARMAVPALIEALTYPYDEDYEVRKSAASSIGQILSSPDALLDLIDTHADRDVRIGLLFGLIQTRVATSAQVQRVLATAKSLTEYADKLVETADLTLRMWSFQNRLLVTDGLVQAWKTELSLVQRRMVLTTLSYMYIREGSSPSPPQGVLDTVLDAARSRDEEVAWAGLSAMARIAHEGTEEAEFLIAFLQHPPESAALRDQAAEALGNNRVLPSRAVPVLVALVKAGDPNGGADRAGVALANYGADAVTAIMQAWSGATLDERARFATVLRQTGAAAAPSVPLLLDAARSLVDPTMALESIRALGAAGIEAVPALPVLASYLHSPDEKLCWAAASAIEDIAATLGPNHLPNGFRARLTTERTLAYASEKVVLLMHDSDDTRTTLARAIGALRSKRLFDISAMGATAASVIAVFLGSVVTSWRLRRFVRELLGERWLFASGSPEFVGRVWRDNGATRLRLAPVESGSILLEDVWGTDDAFVQRIRKARGEGSTVAVETEEVLFADTWAHVYGDPWATVNATIAGQLCLAQSWKHTPRLRGRRLVYSGLWCCQGPESTNPLLMAQAEIAEGRAVLSRWGAVTETSDEPAHRELFAQALTSADIVHVAAHADPNSIYFAGTKGGVEVFDAESLRDIPPENLHTGLLILSGCETGRLHQRAGLLWELVLRGVNVLATTAPVNDYVARVFVSEFLRNLLPGPRAGGVPLADAVRLASARCRDRFERDPVPGAKAGACGSRWTDTVNAFTFYGNPTLNIRLRRDARSGQLAVRHTLAHREKERSS